MYGNKKPTLSGLKADLRCANEEAQGYLKRLVDCEARERRLTAERDSSRQDHIEFAALVIVLRRALQEAYIRLDGK